MANSADLVQAIAACIENSETNKASSILEDPKNKESISSNCWDIIHILCAKLSEDVYNKQPAMFHCCEKLLNKVTELSCPEEALLELIEQAECPDNDHRFLALLKPIHNLLKRMPDKRGRSLVWCLNLVAAHLSALEEPNCYKFQGNEKVLLDLDPATRRAIDIYDSIVPFYEPFIEEVSLFRPYESADKPIAAQRQYQRYVLAAFLIHLLGKPLVFMDLDYDGKTKSRIYCIAENIVGFLDHLMPDLVPVLFDKFIAKKKISDNDDWDEDPIKMFLYEDKVPTLGLANLVFLAIAGGLSRQCIPSVYSSNYIFQIGLHLSTELLQVSHDSSVWKGLQLAERLMLTVSNSSVPFRMLDLPVHEKFCTTLEKVVVYCEVEGYRGKGIKVFQNYVMLMDLAAQYQVFIKLFPVLQHSGFKGLLVTMLKDTIRLTLNSVQIPYVHLYRGKSLLKLLEVYCVVPNGPEVDLMDHSDHIISLLNLLWYLSLADRGDVLGLWEHAPYLDRNFIHPLKNGLKLSRAHYELKIHQLEEERMGPQGKDSKKEKIEVAVTVHGEAVSDLSYEEKKQILNVALNKFSIMESLLSNIREKVEGIRLSWSTTPRHFLSTDTSSGQGTSSGQVQDDHSAAQQNQDSRKSSTQSENEYDRDIARQILAASIPFVNKSGWTKAALSEGAETLGYAGIAHGMFPLGGVELVNYFYTSCNEKLVEKLKQEYESLPEGKLPHPEVVVCNAVEARLRMITPHIDRWPEAMVLLSIPRNVPTSLANLLTLVDDICYYSGDRSVDVRWYSRRIGLAAVYKMTELYFIQDQSEDHKSTWKFLQQRVEEAVQLQRILREAGISPKIALDTISATFDAARSILRIR